MHVFVHVVEARIHWGYSIRSYPGSGPQPSFTVIPPTSLVGALAYAMDTRGEYVSRNGEIYSGAIRFVEEYWPFYITTSFTDLEIPPVRSLQMIKFFSAPYRAFADVEEVIARLNLTELRSPIQLGYTVIPLQTLSILIVSRKRIDPRVLWSISRVGSKESHVSVINVCTSQTELVLKHAQDRVDIINTCTPSDMLLRYTAPKLVLTEAIPYPLSFNDWLNYFEVYTRKSVPSVNVVLPLPEIIDVRVAKDALLMEAECEGKKYVALIPTEALR